MTTRQPDDICPAREPQPNHPTTPLATPIYTTSVWECSSPAQADQLLGGELQGYVYQRDGHPNADVLAAKLRELHGAEHAAITATGMAALSTVVLSQVKTGDRVLVSDQLYGRSTQLFTTELARLGVPHTLVNACDLDSVRQALQQPARMMLVETIANPLLRVTDISALADLCGERGVLLAVDNTFATPALFQPLAAGADFAIESASKLLNGHSDVMLGYLATNTPHWDRIPQVISTWGLSSSAFECWLAARGLSTLHLRLERASSNALHIARWLDADSRVQRVIYPGLDSHPDHMLAARQFSGRFGWMLTFDLPDRAAAEAFISASHDIPFCPSLGEICTTLSHPESTSHRGLTPAARNALGIHGGTLRLSVGIESPETIVSAFESALQ